MCDKAHEMDVESWFSALSDAAKIQGFEVETQLTEVVGICPQCSKESSSKESASKEQNQFDKEEIVLLGTNKYPNANDKMKNDLELYPFVKTNKTMNIFDGDI